VADLGGSEEKNALNTLARHVSQNIKAAMDMLEERRKEAA